MKDMKLVQLGIRNFKGQREISLSFDGQNAALYGDNAAGKTTIYDALTWLLFGKDSRGQSNFDIKPLGPDGRVADHGAVTTVEAALSVDAVETVLKKTYFEKWSTKRGSAAESYDGNTSEYYVDGVPVKKYEFESRVEDLVDEDLFRILTGASWFCEGLDWRSRRKTLFDVCGVLSDAEMLSGAAQFAPLAAAMGRLSVDDVKKKLLAERRGLSGARDSIPARLDECCKSVSDLEGTDFSLLRTQREETQRQVDRLKSELLKLQHGTLLGAKRNELADWNNQLAACINENNIHRTSQMVPFVDRRPALREEIARTQRQLSRCNELARNEKSVSEEYGQRVEKFRNLWATEDARIFDPATCPACGQMLPPAAMALALERFEAEKERRKADIVSQADTYKETIRTAEARREGYIKDAVEAENQIARWKDDLAACKEPAQAEITDLPGHGDRVAHVEARIAALKTELSDLEGESAAIRREIEEKIAALVREVNSLEQELAKESLLDYNRRRVEELRREAQQGARQLEALDKLLFLIDEFTRYKVRFIEERINSRFGMVRWRLFSEQVNGGLNECCEATVDGVPYASLNNGARINAGLDVIAALSEHYGVRVPLFVDNAESVTRLRETGGQVIRLVVSETDEKLRCVYEDR